MSAPAENGLPQGVNNEDELRVKQEEAREKRADRLRSRSEHDPKNVKGQQQLLEEAGEPAPEDGGTVTQWGWEQKARQELEIPYGVPNIQGLSADHDADYADANRLGGGTLLNTHKAREVAFFGMPSALLDMTVHGKKVLAERDSQQEERLESKNREAQKDKNDKAK
jgi:hypothetical protein